MSFTTTEPTTPPLAEADYTPVYARRGTRQKKIRSWMILAPIGAVVLIGGAALILTNGDEEAQPLVEPETASVMAPIVNTPAPLETASAPLVPAATPAPVQVARDPAPLRRVTPVATPARRAAPAVTAQAPAPRVQAPAEATGPQPYSAGPSTPLSAAPAPSAPAPVAPRAPVIVVQPLG